MPRMSYVALTRGGETVTGWLDAPTLQEGLAQLRSQGMTPLDVSAGWSWRLGGGLRRRVKPEEAAHLLRNLATIVAQSGAPLSDVLRALVDEEEMPHLRSVLASIADAVLRDARTMSDALARHADIFPPVVIKRVAAGEATGQLGAALEDAASFMESAVTTRKRIVGALLYPGILVGLTLFIVSALSMTVMPKFADFYAQAHVPLPLLSRIVIGFGRALARGWPVIAALLVTGGVAARRAMTKPEVRDRVDRLLWRLPVTGRVTRALAWSRWARVMALLHRTGLPLMQSLQLACEASGTAVIRDVAELLIRRAGGRGGQLRRAMQEAGVFPPLLITRVGIGEARGSMAQMLEDAAAWYDRSVNQVLDQLPTLLQPIMIAFVGGIIGLMVLSLYLPMFHLYGIINRIR
jgi:type IV pilus assembly protein PilC